MYWRWVEEGGYVQPDHGLVPPLLWFLLAERLDQRGRSSHSQFRARWDSNHGASTSRCDMILITMRGHCYALESLHQLHMHVQTFNAQKAGRQAEWPAHIQLSGAAAD